MTTMYDTHTPEGRQKRWEYFQRQKIDALLRKYKATWNKKYVHFAWMMGYPVDYSDKDHAGEPKYE